MVRWSAWKVLMFGAAYVLLYLAVSAGIFLRWRALHRQPDGSWRFLLIPTTDVRNYAAGLLAPPVALLLAWLVARALGAFRQAAV